MYVNNVLDCTEFSSNNVSVNNIHGKGGIRGLDQADITPGAVDTLVFIQNKRNVLTQTEQQN